MKPIGVRLIKSEFASEVGGKGRRIFGQTDGRTLKIRNIQSACPLTDKK